MNFVSRTFLSLIVACVFFAGIFVPFAMAAEPAFSSPKGFTITPPDAWTLVSKDAAQGINAAIKKQYPKLDNFNVDTMAVMLLNPTDRGATNLNVVVTPSRLPLGDSGAEEKVSSMMREQYTKLGVTISKMAATRRNFGIHPAIVADFESNIGGAPTRQWQVLMASGKQTLIVTCTSSQSDFEKFAPVFTKAIESMTFPAPASAEFPLWLKYGIIGGVAGGLIGVFQKLIASKKKA